MSQPVRYADLARQLGVEVGSAGSARARPGGGPGPAPPPRDGARRADHDTWSCGSFFTNPILSATEFEALEARVAERLGADAPTPPRFADTDGNVKTSAAWLIERAGFGKGFGMPGPAALSTKHTLAVTNRGEATASDVTALARRVRDGVSDAFGITLVNEPALVGSLSAPLLSARGSGLLTRPVRRRCTWARTSRVPRCLPADASAYHHHGGPRTRPGSVTWWAGKRRPPPRTRAMSSARGQNAGWTG